jgi:hypothetical protein
MSDRLTVDGDVISQRAGLQSGLITNFQFQVGDGSLLYNNQNEINGWCRRNRSWNKIVGEWKNNSNYINNTSYKQTELAIKNPNIVGSLFDTNGTQISINYTTFINNNQGNLRITNNHPTYIVTAIFIGENTANCAPVIYFSGKNFPISTGESGIFIRDLNGPSGSTTCVSGTGIGSAAYSWANTSGGGSSGTAFSSFGCFFDNNSLDPGVGRTAVLTFN